MSTGAQYVVAAYGVVLFGLLMYVLVLGLRTARLAREAELLARLIEREDEARARPRAGGDAMSGNRVAPSRPPGPGKVFYPMFVDIEGRRCLVVGGGPVATEKVEKLLEHGAVVRLVTPAMTDALAAMVASGAVAEHRGRGYAAQDLDGCFLVIAATNLDAINRMVWQDAEARNLLCNVVDVPAALQLHRALHRAARRARTGHLHRRRQPGGREAHPPRARGRHTAPSGRRWSTCCGTSATS